MNEAPNSKKNTSNFSAQDATECVERILKADNRPSRLTEKDILYATSSDPLKVLESLDVAGKTVATICGSGEFAQIFMNQGAKSVKAIDTSISSCCYAELQYAAMQFLSFDEYVEAFGTWKNEGRDIQWSSLVSASAWSRIRNSVSEPTRIFFDRLAEAKGTHKHGFSFLRARSSRYADIPAYESYIGSPAFGVGTAENYQALQSRTSGCDIEIVNGDFVRTCDANAKKPDIAYISNIGYGVTETCQCVERLKAQGIPRIIFSMDSMEGGLRLHRGRIFDLSEMYGLRADEPDDWTTVRFLIQKPHCIPPDPVFRENEELVVPGQVINLKGVQVRFVGSDSRSALPIICETVDNAESASSTLEDAREYLRHRVGESLLLQSGRK